MTHAPAYTSKVERTFFSHIICVNFGNRDFYDFVLAVTVAVSIIYKQHESDMNFVYIHGEFSRCQSLVELLRDRALVAENTDHQSIRRQFYKIGS